MSEMANVYTHNGVDIRDFLDFDGEKLFESFIREGQRIGQAWLNACPPDIYHALSGTIADPFHRDTAGAVVSAIEFLTGGK